MKHFYFRVFIVLFACSIGYSQSTEIGIVRSYLENTGLNTEDIEDLAIQSQSFSKSMQATVVYVVQQFKGIPIRNSIGSFALKNGKVASFQGAYIKEVATKVNSVSPSLSQEDAIRSAATLLNIGQVQNLKEIAEKSSGTTKVFKADISIDEIPVQLVYEIVNDKLILSWDLSINTGDGKNWYSVRIGADNGDIIDQDNWMLSCSFGDHSSYNVIANRTSVLHSESQPTSVIMAPSYRVYPIPAVESPNHGSRELISGVEDATASPFGWHDTDGVAGHEFTTTQGNNVLASEDLDGDDEPGNQPDGGANLVFDYPFDPTLTVSEFQNASLTNLFYANNVIHDVWYQYGFDEASGNFQSNNYGKGGAENDYVIADGQDGSGTNNARFGTPPDGFNPRMIMFLWNPKTLKFTINNTDIAGEYEIIENTFIPGTLPPPVEPNGITADLVLAVDDNPTPDPNDVCSDLSNAADLNGKIAVVRAGTCDFIDKVLKCQQAGAVAILVVNNAPGTFVLDGRGPASKPTVGINGTDGEAIITAMVSQTVSATLSSKRPEDWLVAADGSFDNGIVIHEYGHGISTRLAGGAATSACLNNAEQMGEGWSDWFGLMMTIEPGDLGTDARGIGTYAIGQPTTGGGIRPFPYSTDMSVNPVTYGDVADASTFSVPHGIGSIWASIIWDMTWAFIDRDGFDPDLYNGKGGNNLAMQLVIDGLKLQACNPGFVSGRDGILAAADLLPNSDANKCLIWEVFARRGVGFSASEGNTNDRTDQTEAFDLPPADQLDCSSLGVDDFNAGIFTIEPNPSKGIFNIRTAENVGDTSIKIFDLNGRKVFEEKTRINGVYRVQSDLRSGVYLLRIEAENGSAVSTSKIVVQ